MKKIEWDLIFLDEERDELMARKKVLVEKRNQSDDGSESWQSFDQSLMILNQQINDITEKMEKIDTELES